MRPCPLQISMNAMNKLIDVLKHVATLLDHIHAPVIVAIVFTATDTLAMVNGGTLPGRLIKNL